MADRLYRSRSDRMISGVAGGLAQQLDVDPSIVRVAWVVLAILSGGILAVVYLVMMVVVPEAPPAADAPGRVDAALAVSRPPRHRGDPGGALVLGVILILLGAFFLLRQYAPHIDIGAVWPILAVAAGIALVVLSLVPRGTR